ncbi:MAG: hypothetical protein PHT95_00590 [Candidatus Omnitrophica bacterium]|jgi:hypothetical protein|nr:hypothetical protein [Candidatus Omnitrophota bacterium]MDD4012675.1 hypothetical protein [Candidatus Omnitrophota bacterium]
MLVYALMFLGIFMRLIPHAPNFVPVAAIALFSGAYLDRKIVPWVPLAIMVLSDVILGMHDVVLYTWGAFALTALIGMFLKERTSPGYIIGATVVSSVLFYVITNFGVWMAWYPRTFDGMAQCYINALPFLRNTMAGNIIFSGILFGTYEAALRFVSQKQLRMVLIASK